MTAGNRLAAVIAYARQLPGEIPTSLRGDLYEMMAHKAFADRFGPKGLHRLALVGQSGDRGVDLIGKWKAIDLLVQCKSTSKKIAGAMWRDLEGVSLQRNSSINAQNLVALVSPMPMTAAAHSEFMSSERPLMHCIIPMAHIGAKLDKKPASIQSVILNDAANALLRQNGTSVVGVDSVDMPLQEPVYEVLQKKSRKSKKNTQKAEASTNDGDTPTKKRTKSKGQKMINAGT